MCSVTNIFQTESVFVEPSASIHWSDFILQARQNGIDTSSRVEYIEYWNAYMEGVWIAEQE